MKSPTPNSYLVFMFLAQLFMFCLLVSTVHSANKTLVSYGRLKRDHEALRRKLGYVDPGYICFSGSTKRQLQKILTNE